MILIRFPTTIQKLTNTSEIYFAVESFSSLFDALKYTFPKLRSYISSISQHNNKELLTLITQDKRIIKETELIRDEINPNIKELWIVPTIYGSGNKGVGLALGVGLLLAGGAYGLSAGGYAGIGAGTSTFGQAVATGFGGTGMSSILAKFAVGLGISLILSTVISSLLPKPKQPSINIDSQERRNNDGFDGLQNTTDTANTIPLIYGLVRSAGQFTSGYVNTINHGKDDLISVSDYT